MTDEQMKPAPSRPCGECPYRTANIGRPVPEGFSTYTKAHRMIAWDSVRRPAVTVCHLSQFDRVQYPEGDDPRWIAAGFMAVPEDAKPRECAGSVAAAMRELRLLREAGSFAEYQRQRPNGLTRESAANWVRRLNGQVDGAPPVRVPKVPESDIIDVPGDPEVSEHEVEQPALWRTMGPFLAEMRASLADTGRQP